MIGIRETTDFKDWIKGLRDTRGRGVILRRIDRMRRGNFGDHRAVGDSVMEMRIDFGPGYRVYFRRHGESLVILLCGGNKDSQDRDIPRAKELAEDV